MTKARTRWAATGLTTALLALAPAAAHAQAGQGATVEPVDDFTVTGAVNPCTGNEVDVLHTDLVGTFRTAPTPDGRTFHVLEAVRGTATTSDGFSGRYVQHFAVTDLDLGSFEDFVVTDRLTYAVHGPDHQTVVYRFRFHLRAVDGEPVASAEVLDARCVGR